MRFIIGLLVGLLLGWIFPVEGPVDYVYDDYIKPKNKEIIIPATKESREIEYDEEEEESLFINLFPFIKEEDKEE